MPKKAEKVKVRQASLEETLVAEELFKEKIYSPFTTDSNPARSVTSIPLVAIKNQIIVGAVQITRLNKDAYRIDHIAVDENERRRGIGKLLLKEAEDVAWIKDASNMEVDALPNSSSFFENCGFEKTGKISIGTIGDTPHYLIGMKKEFATSQEVV